eukprot:363259-Chlamydomonas_euryale.AAC.1
MPFPAGRWQTGEAFLCVYVCVRSGTGWYNPSVPAHTLAQQRLSDGERDVSQGARVAGSRPAKDMRLWRMQAYARTGHAPVRSACKQAHPKAAGSTTLVNA